VTVPGSARTAAGTNAGNAAVATTAVAARVLRR
jgi:hypothetical protein